MMHADVLQAISDSTRLKLLELLIHRNYCVGVLAEILGISAPAVSQHLKVLQQAGVVTSERMGYHIHYHVERDVLRQAAAELQALAAIETSPCEKRGSRCGRQGGCCQRKQCHK